MDYIREELLRQKKVLAGLMSGGTQAREGADDAEMGTTAERGPIGQEPAESAHERAWEDVILGRTKRSSVREGMSGAGHQGAGSAFGGTVRAARGLHRSPYHSDVLQGSVYMVPYERSVAGTTTDVRNVSRSIQRDARRYDGGFSMY